MSRALLIRRVYNLTCGRQFPSLGLAVLALVIALSAPAYACGRERWPAKVLSDGVAIDAAHPAVASVDQLRALSRPPGVGGFDASRVPAERRVYRIQAELLGFKLESDGDIHLVIAQPGNRAHTMIAEIPDPRCMSGAPPVYSNDVARTRLAFVKAYGIPPATHFRIAYKPITVVGPAFFDFLHGQDGLAPNGIEIHPVLAIGTGAGAPAPEAPRPSSTSSASASATSSCPGDVLVWVNTRSGIYHLPGTRWYGRTREGRFMCERQADADGYRAARNGE